MNRRGFFSTLAKAAAGFTILPAATTYERIWRVQRGPIVPVGVDWYNKLPYWFALNYAGEEVKIIRTFWKTFPSRIRSPFPPNMGEVISQSIKQTNH